MGDLLPDPLKIPSLACLANPSQWPSHLRTSQQKLHLPGRPTTQRCHLPWNVAAFWVMRNFSSMLADCRSCSMLERAMAWYFSSIFREQHVRPLGMHTCKSDPAGRTSGSIPLAHSRSSNREAGTGMFRDSGCFGKGILESSGL